MRLRRKMQAHFPIGAAMYQKDYFFAGLGIRMISDVPPEEDENTAVFRQTGEKIHSTCRIACVQQLPQVHGAQLMQTNELRLFRSGDTLYQQLLSPLDGHPLTVSMYAAAQKSEVSLYLSQTDMPYIARSVHLWSGMDINHILLMHHRVVMHSASVRTEHGVILFAAPSGVGKSTQAQLWHEHRQAEILNGDKNAVGIEQGTAMAYGLPFCGTSSICQPYQLPLRAIVLLEQARQNQITQLQGIEAVICVLRNCMGHQAVREVGNMMLEQIADLLEIIPVYRLACTPDVRAVQALENALGEY